MSGPMKYRGCVWVLVNAKIERQTKAAVLFGTVWIPKSMIYSIEYDEGGDADDIRIGQLVRSVCVPEWFAEKNDLEF